MFEVLRRMRHVVIIIGMIIMIFSCNDSQKLTTKVQKQELIPVKHFLYGYDTDSFRVVKDTIRKNETLGVILDRNHVFPQRIYEVVMQIKDTFDVKKIKVGRPYTLFLSKDSLETVKVFVYQPSKSMYVAIDMRDSIVKVLYKNKDIIKVKKVAAGIITSSLFQNLAKHRINEVLALKLADIYAWTVDFYHIYKNDKFKVIYDELYVDDTVSIGIGDIHAAYFEHHNKPFYAFRYVLDTASGMPEYFDEKSRNLQKAFLKSPLKFGRVSSRFNRHRFLKYYGRVKPHLGTDFAAPVGTPILSTANGVVIASSYTRGNGKYVKIKHNSTYTTQYLHMSRRAVQVGDIVRQGQVIGYIGMTGSTTGPHVCYRLWKNGEQIDALREKFPDAKPMPDSVKQKYFEYIKPWKKQLDSILYPEMIHDTIHAIP